MKKRNRILKKSARFTVVFLVILGISLSNLPFNTVSKIIDSYLEARSIVDLAWKAQKDSMVVDKALSLRSLSENLKIHSAQAAVGFVGSTSVAGNNGADAALTLSGLGLQEGDLVIVSYGIPDADNVDFNMALVGASGWTESADLFSNDTYDANLGVYYKVMGSSPDASVTVDGLGGTDTQTIAVAMAFRGVDIANPMDVTSTTATALNTMHPNPPSINHNNPSGVWTVIAGSNVFGNTGTRTFTFPSGYTTSAVQQLANDTSDGIVGLGYRSSGVSDPEDPGVMTTSGTDSTSYAWAAVTMALRPAVASDATVSTSGSQTSAMVIPSTNNDVGGKFAIAETGGGSRNVTGITIAEQGTVDAQADLDNIKLYYESDTSNPYDCASESLSSPSSPTENQFGSTDADGFSAANGTSAFSGTSVGISTTSTMCVYAILDIGSGASDAETLEIQITNPSTDVTTSAGTIGPTSAVAISGTTTLSPPGVTGTLGKTADGWSGAVPVYMTLDGLDQGSYPYARAQVTTIASQTFYADMAWDSGDSRYEGTIYIGSNICMGCDDPKTYNGSFAVTVQLDNNSGFPSVDYSGSAGTFTTAVTLKRSSMDAVQATNYTDFNAAWSTDHWNISIQDFAFSMNAGTGTNFAVAVPIYPDTSSPSNFAVSYGGTSISQGSAASTTNAWWYESASHTLYLQFASLTTTLVDVDITFDNDTDLFATRYNHTQTYDMGSRKGSNGLFIANQYLTTFVYGKPLSTADNNVACSGNECEMTGMQAESRAHETGGPDESTDCMERVAVHVDGTPRSDATTYYQYDVKWKQTETASWITSQSNSQIVIETNSDDTASTGWAQQLNNGIAAERIQTYYAGERYIKNIYNFTNNDSVSHNYPMVWEREQWHGTDRATNDSGRFYGDTSDRVVEERIALSGFTCPWQTAYDTGTFINMGVIYDSGNLPDYGIFAVEPFLAPTTAEWPITITDTHATQTADQTGFEKTWSSVAASSTVDFTFWHVHNAESSWADIETAMNADCDEVNPSTIISLTISDGNIGYGYVETSADTTGVGGDTQTITNNGNVAEDFEIMGQNSTNWTLAGSAGDATYKHEWCTSNCDSSPTWNALTAAYQALASNIGVLSTQDFDLKITVPTVNPGSNEQDVSVTIRAVQH